MDKLDWAAGVDTKGRPIVVPGKDPTPAGNRVCPGVRGATNWMSPSFNPATKLLYVVTLEQCDIYTSSSKEPVPKKSFSGGGAGPKPSELGQFFLRALDPTSGTRVWQYPMTGPAESWAGTLSTAGGLVFFGDDDGHLVAVNAQTGNHLWHFQMGEGLFGLADHVQRGRHPIRRDRLLNCDLLIRLVRTPGADATAGAAATALTTPSATRPRGRRFVTHRR